MTDSGCEFKNSSDISPNRLEPLCLSEKWKVRCFVNTPPTSHPHLTLLNDVLSPLIRGGPKAGIFLTEHKDTKTRSFYYDDDYDHDDDDLSALWAV